MTLKENSLNQRWKKCQKQLKSNRRFWEKKNESKKIFLYEYFRIQKLQKLKEEEIDFRAHLKQSTNKFALKDEHKDEDKFKYRDQIQLKSTKTEHYHDED